MVQKKTNTLYSLIKISFAAASLAAAWFLFTPFATLKRFFDGLSPDQNLEMFTLSLYPIVPPLAKLLLK